ncbi:MAG: PAS domain-containing protein, partial [Rhodocyclaceae bacterium]|nr:PAS domain-containing protein [Rhodocyclaceae bacterium]
MATQSRALKIAALYALFGVAWSVLSDRIILLFAPDASVFAHLEVWKGVVFVLLSAVMLFLAAGGLRKAGFHGPEDVGAPGTTSLILVFAGLASAIVLVGLVGVAHTADKQREKEVARLQSIADLKVRQIALWFGERLADARVVRNDVALTETYSAWRQSGDDALRLRLLERLRMHGATHDYPVVALLDETGDILMQSDGPPDNPAAMRDAVLRAFATGEATSTDLYQTGPAGHERVHLDFIAPLRSAPDGPRLAVVLRVDPNRFLFPYIQAWPVPSASAETLLFRGEGGHVLFLNELRHRSDTALKLRVPFERGADLLAVQVLQGRAKPGEPVEGRDYRDVPVLGVVKAIPATAWFLVTKLDKAELYAQAKSDAGWIALAEVLALSVAAVALVLAHQRRELRHALARRREQDEKLRALHLLDAVAECSTDAIFAKDREGRYLQANREMCRSLGRTREEIVGRHDRDLFPAEDAERLAAFDRRVLAGGQVMSSEEALTTGGGVRTFLSTKGPLL